MHPEARLYHLMQYEFLEIYPINPKPSQSTARHQSQQRKLSATQLDLEL